VAAKTASTLGSPAEVRRTITGATQSAEEVSGILV
jgi:hypothetical protein